ncbi:MAG: hypothetical protein KDI56_07070 [Xanthomonadales bacterium]|nr:hypothetical protein [Caldilinea sp.]MCB1588646.1 hypothetical protein [Xanthomonadales bacterium]
MDELQALRMTIMWPGVVGAAAFLLTRAAFWILLGKLTRELIIACVAVGVAGAVVALSIALAWDNGPAYWLAFTVGLLVLEMILLVTCAQAVVEAWWQ